LLEIKEYSNEDLKAIFGKNKKGIAFFDIWIKKYPILENNDVVKWLSVKIRKFAQKGKEPSKFNITSYVKALQDYCNYNKLSNPSEITEKLLKENIDTRNNRLLTYLNHLIQQGKNVVSVKNAYQSRIKSFYSSRGAPITEGLDSESHGENKYEIDLNKEKLQNILNHINNSQYKVIAKIQALLGIRVNDVLKELVAKKKDSKEPKYRIELYKDTHYCIRNFQTQKEKVRIKNVFFPKELSQLLRTTYQKNLTELDLSKDILKTKNGNTISSIEYHRKLRKVANELYPKENMKTHSLRKYFYTNLGHVNLSDYVRDNKSINLTIGSEVEEKFKEHLMGHKLNYSSTVYNRIMNNRETFYELWKPLEISLCIDCDIVDTTSKDILKVKEENVKLKEQIDDLLKDGLQMKRLMLELYAKVENIDLNEEFPLEITEYAQKGKTDKENKAIMEKENETIRYLRQIKKDLE